ISLGSAAAAASAIDEESTSAVSRRNPSIRALLDSVPHYQGLQSWSQESHDGVGDGCGRLPLREMADAIEDGALVPRGEEALLPLRSGWVVARIAAAVDDQRRDADGRVPRKLGLGGGVGRIGRRQ